MDTRRVKRGQQNQPQNQPQRQEDPKDTYSCSLCDAIDSRDMVYCDSCNALFHFTCVGVTSEVEHQDWNCFQCRAAKLNSAHLRGESHSVRSTGSTSKQKMLALKRLEEENVLREKRDSYYLTQKYQILELSDNDSGEDEVEASSLENTLRWVKEVQNIERNVDNVVLDDEILSISITEDERTTINQMYGTNLHPLLLDYDDVNPQQVRNITTDARQNIQPPRLINSTNAPMNNQVPSIGNAGYCFSSAPVFNPVNSNFGFQSTPMPMRYDNADDKKLAAFINSEDDANQLQVGIFSFMRWCNENKLQINQGKCKVITFTRKKKPIIFKYTMNGIPIKRVTETMDLGVLFDHDGRFRSHWEYMTNRANSTLKFVKRQSQYFGKGTIKLIYQSLVRSLLEFAAPIWSPIHSVHKKKIESVQKQMVLFLLGDDKRYLTESYELSPYTERCQQLNLTTLVRRRINMIILFVHAIIIGKYSSPYLRSMITISNNQRALRRPNFIWITFYDDSPFVTACRLFNIAANQIDPSLPRSQFRASLIDLPDELFGHWITI